MKALNKVKKIKKKVLDKKKGNRNTFKDEESKSLMHSMIASKRKTYNATLRGPRPEISEEVEDEEEVSKHDFGIDDYKEGHEIGQGAAGIWFNAFDNNSGNLFTYKSLDMSELPNEAVDRRLSYLKDSVEFVKQTANEHIIQYYNVSKQKKPASK